MSGETREVITLREASARLNRGLNQVRIYMERGAIERVPGPHPQDAGPRRGVKVWVYADSLANVAKLKNPYHEARRLAHEAALAAGGRNCVACGLWKPWEDYHEHANGINGRNSRCRECQRDYGRKWAKKHQPERSAYRLRYFQTHRDRENALRNERNRRHRRLKTDRAQKVRRQNLRYYHLIRVIQDGKSSPICRTTGFSVVFWRDQEKDAERYRAARADCPIAAHETALALAHRVAEVWVWTPPQVIPIALRPLARSVLAFCLGREKRASPKKAGRPQRVLGQNSGGVPKQ